MHFLKTYGREQGGAYQGRNWGGGWGPSCISHFGKGHVSKQKPHNLLQLS